MGKLKGKARVEFGKIVFNIEDDFVLYTTKLNEVLNKYSGAEVGTPGLEMFIRLDILSVLDEFGITFEPTVSMSGNNVDISYSETRFN